MDVWLWGQAGITRTEFKLPRSGKQNEGQSSEHLHLVRSTGLSMEFSLQRSHFPGHNPNSSLGPDGIHLRALNQPKDEITPLQAAVCTSPWEPSVSGDGKVGKWLIFTKDSRGDLRNYRWVNMMSLFSKSVEATARNRMSRHMEKYIGKHSIKHL